VGQSEDWLALQVALAPCLIGYGEIATQLHRDERSVRTGNRYWKWVENYVADDYSEAVGAGTGEACQFQLGCRTTLLSGLALTGRSFSNFDNRYPRAEYENGFPEPT
jgi:hypothetical protein